MNYVCTNGPSKVCLSSIHYTKISIQDGFVWNGMWHNQIGMNTGLVLLCCLAVSNASTESCILLHVHIWWIAQGRAEHHHLCYSGLTYTCKTWHTHARPPIMRDYPCESNVRTAVVRPQNWWFWCDLKWQGLLYFEDFWLII